MNECKDRCRLLIIFIVYYEMRADGGIVLRQVNKSLHDVFQS